MNDHLFKVKRYWNGLFKSKDRQYIKDNNNNIFMNENPIESSKKTDGYFCFKCGAILTTLENKQQHELIEANKKTHQDDEDH